MTAFELLIADVQAAALLGRSFDIRFAQEKEKHVEASDEYAVIASLQTHFAETVRQTEDRVRHFEETRRQQLGPAGEPRRVELEMSDRLVAGLAEYANSEGFSLEQALRLAVAEKIARREHDVWLVGRSAMSDNQLEAPRLVGTQLD